MFDKKSILIIAPHPDDEAICCGGLIMQAKKQNAKIFVLFMAIGYSRQFLTGSTNSTTRIKEIKKAAKMGNYSWSIAFKGKPFMRLDSLPQKDIIEKIEDIAQKVKPDIVCIPQRDSFDQDHRAVSQACITAFRPLPSDLKHQPTVVLEAEEPYTWSTSSANTPINFYVDVSDCFQEKITLLACHKTQLREDPFPRSPQNLERLAGIRGCDVGKKYAEGYRLLRSVIL
ncbi:MAG TPA: PIG-L deacetylase family protein [Patescibacteria group bacterium]|nr:PIG-L deacetylase family protein [Patescibacteria group bacterium]